MSSVPEARSSSLLLQADNSEVGLVAELSKRHGYGAILTAPSNPKWDHQAYLVKGAEDFFNLTGTVPDLDANWYSGKHRRTGDSELSLSWAMQQVALGTPHIMTDAGYICAGHRDHLLSALDQAVALQDTIGRRLRATIALDAEWVRKEHSQLVDEFHERDLHIALAIGHPGDPLGPQSTVKGLMEIVKLGTVSLIRTDLSAFGAIASGAPDAAIGTRTSLRHVYTRKGAKGRSSDWPSIIVNSTMAYRTQDRINDLIFNFADDVLWTCYCSWCGGVKLDASLRPFDYVGITEHNYNVTAMIAHDVLSSPDPLKTWISKCKVAQSYILEVSAETGIPWDPPDFLGGWIANEPSLVGV